MKTIIKWLLAIHLATIIHGDKCCAPNKWQGFQYGDGNLSRATSFEAERVYYDADIKKFALSGVYVTDEMKTEGKMILDYNAAKCYVIKPATEECTIKTIDIVFPEFCVPDNAEEILSSYVGDGEKKINVKGYRYPIKEDVYEVEVYYVVTESEGGCIPVSLAERGTYNKTKYFEILNFFQIMAGITDDTIFNPPDYCNQAITDQTD